MMMENEHLFRNIKMGQESSKFDTNNNQNNLIKLKSKLRQHGCDEFCDIYKYLERRPSRLMEILDEQCLDMKTILMNTWNPNDTSRNIDVLTNTDPCTLYRHPIARSTDSIRGKTGYSKGFHVWQIKWDRSKRGTDAVIGICTKDAPLHLDDYSILVGGTEDSWGWDIVRRKLYHNAKSESDGVAYPRCSNVNQTYKVSEVITVILDMDEGTLAFEDDGRYLGIAFRGLKGKTVYPTISTVWGHVEISLKYLGSSSPQPSSLKSIARESIRERIGDEHLDVIKKLILPVSLKSYLLYS